MELVTLDRLITGVLAFAIIGLIAYRRGGQIVHLRVRKGVTSTKTHSR